MAAVEILALEHNAPADKISGTDGKRHLVWVDPYWTSSGDSNDRLHRPVKGWIRRPSCLWWTDMIIRSRLNYWMTHDSILVADVNRGILVPSKCSPGMTRQSVGGHNILTFLSEIKRFSSVENPMRGDKNDLPTNSREAGNWFRWRIWNTDP